MKLKSVILGVAFLAATGTGALAQDQIRIVGSSTVYPFSTVVAERFGRTTSHPTPIVESTGTGGGFKLFCEGVAGDTPSVTNASRAVKSSETTDCAANGVSDILEVKIGYDGIVIANSVNSQAFKLTTRDIFLALAINVPTQSGTLMENPYESWNDVNSSLPDVEIEVLGPPPTSGTRDAFLELAMEAGCNQFPFIKALKRLDRTAYKAVCHGIREDGAFVEAGENDNLIVQRLKSNPSALGIFGFSFLDQNLDVVKASYINGVEATFENIADGSYPISRPLFFYVKGAHFNSVDGLREFVREFASDNASGEYGYLADRGLIPMPKAERDNLKAVLLK